MMSRLRHRSDTSCSLNLLSPAALLLMLVGLASTTQAQSQRDVEVQEVEQRITEVEGRKQSADQWGLTELEWERYESLMRGQRGILSPGLDPLTALGVEARTDQERTRYAELQARFEYERIEREMAYQHAYDVAIGRLTENADRVKPFVLSPVLSEQNRAADSRGLSTGPVRYDVVVTLADCKTCDSTVQTLLGQGRAMNIWIADSGGKDERIRAWAGKVGIPADKVMSGVITLNHGNALNVSKDAVPVVRLRP